MTDRELSRRPAASRRLHAERTRLLGDGPPEEVPLSRVGERPPADPIVAETDVPAHDVATIPESHRPFTGGVAAR
ncbi:hypothetical protein [Haladaptatus sp. ZSTT2]|uniref:hypothetical protein n=1 Tax=Haladaptatus sp. ZSTT2 TaxID=3120515 RepID=UPI00300F5887